MNIKIMPINNLSLSFYSAGVPLLIFCWLDQWLQMYLVSDKLRIQLFIVAIIVIATRGTYRSLGEECRCYYEENQ